MSTLDPLIAQNYEFATKALNNANRLALGISNVFPGATQKASLNFTPRKPLLEKPPTFGDLLPTDTTGQTIKFLDAEKERWMNTYFPELQGCLRDKPEKWLCKIIGGDDPFADSQSIFDVVWHQARDQATRERMSANRTARAEFSSRGFTLPPGAMIGVMADADVRAAGAVAQVSRAEMERVSQIKLELLKYAEEQAINLKLGIMSALANFYQQWIKLPEKDIEIARVRAQLVASLQGALSEYQRVELDWEQLRLNAEQIRMGATVENNKLKVASAGNNQAASARAMAAKGFADTAAAAIGSNAALVADLNAGEA